MCSPRRSASSLVWAVLVASLPGAAQSHHAAAAIYDRQSIVEVTGTITAIVWRNPHVRFTIQSADGGAIWDIESNSVSILSRMNVTSDVVHVGETVRVAGWRARQDPQALFVQNMLLPDGREALLAPGGTPRWSSDTLGDASALLGARPAVTETAGASRGIFKVWSEDMSAPRLFKDVASTDQAWPLTPAAAAARAAWDPVADSPYLGCTPMGMPRLMGQPYPMEFIDRGDHLLLKIELYDTMRTIHINDPSDPQAQARTPLGYSVGHWEGSTLVVQTSRIDWPYFDQSGIPQSAAAELDERFSPTADGSRLDYELTVVDPTTFTAPVKLEKSWVWRPGEQVQRFDCALDH